MIEIDLDSYDYHLPEERIAQYPVKERDLSKLLLYRRQHLSSDIFRNIGKYIPPDSLMVFNNTRVIRARLLFRKDSGALIEIFCLEPLAPGDYEQSFGSKQPVDWKCIIGNLKKWKSKVIKGYFGSGSRQHLLSAEKVSSEGDVWRIRFSWSDRDAAFGEVIEASGHIPLPPYINRTDIKEDAKRYQTVYSRIDGSVAAPTAGLHFTRSVMESLREKGIRLAHLTLHVGAGTFQPFRSANVSDHHMHREHYYISKDTIELLDAYQGRTIAVGTTSVRTLESIYWLGAKISRLKENSIGSLLTDQWEPYTSDNNVPVSESLTALLGMMSKSNLHSLDAATRIMIIPGYQFRMTGGIVTNFHQPRSTLILLIAAWLGKDWMKVYNYALSNNFRFLSYGDSSLLLREL